MEKCMNEIDSWLHKMSENVISHKSINPLTNQ